MRKYTPAELGAILTREETLRAGDELRGLEAGPAWFRLSQLLHEHELSEFDILRRSPRGLEAKDYAERHGAIRMIETIREDFETILKEAAAAREQ